MDRYELGILSYTCGTPFSVYAPALWRLASATDRRPSICAGNPWDGAAGPVIQARHQIRRGYGCGVEPL
jgi:hypothetical protein